MTERIVVIGAGGFGREALDVLRAVAQVTPESVVLEGVVDSSPSDRALASLRRGGIPYLGSVESWFASGPTGSYIIGIGAPATRLRLSTAADALGLKAATIIHPDAVLGSDTFIGEGSVVCAGVHISTGVRLGRHVHVNPNATVGHDADIADFVSINPAAVISGSVSVGTGALVGAASVILQGLSVGDRAVVGAAACVTRDVLPDSIVKGVPAR